MNTILKWAKSMNPWIKASQIARRQQIDKTLALTQKVYLEVPEIKEQKIEGLRETLWAAYYAEKDKPRKFKILLACLGLETLDAGYLLAYDELPGVEVPLETYEEWCLQDKEYRARMS